MVDAGFHFTTPLHCVRLCSKNAGMSSCLLATDEPWMQAPLVFRVPSSTTFDNRFSIAIATFGPEDQRTKV
jgi:hypothetical protein